MGRLRVGRPALTPIVVLGATGSIGAQTLEVADRLNCPVVAIATGSVSPGLVALAGRYPDKVKELKQLWEDWQADCASSRAGRKKR